MCSEKVTLRCSALDCCSIDPCVTQKWLAIESPAVHLYFLLFYNITPSSLFRLFVYSMQFMVNCSTPLKENVLLCPLQVMKPGTFKQQWVVMLWKDGHVQKDI